MKRLLFAAALVACACPSKQSAEPSGGSAAIAAPGTACEGVRAKVEQLYRAEAEAKEPKRVAEAVADNTRMVMVDCAKAPDKIAACVAAAATVAEIEHKCLLPLDEDGTERAPR